jgi:hypothetical protein
VAALVLLVMALVIPQFTWADHASDHPDSQFDNLASISPSEAYVALVENYAMGNLVYNAPGRRGDSPSTAFAGPAQIGVTFVSANPEIMTVQRYAAGVAQETGADLLATNPEIAAYRRYAVSRQDVAAAASSARWVALGAYYTARGAAFQATNPEIAAYRRFAVSPPDVAAAASSARWAALGAYYTARGSTFLATNPEIAAYRQYVSRQECSASGLNC